MNIKKQTKIIIDLNSIIIIGLLIWILTVVTSLDENVEAIKHQVNDEITGEF